LFDLHRRERINRFRGHKQENNIIKIGFGGANENMVVSGSEDANIYLWNCDKGDLLAKLEGHSDIVNCISWHPRDPLILASASDDKCVRVWGAGEMEMAEVVVDPKDIKKGGV
jgi:WD40 repeat protein